MTLDLAVDGNASRKNLCYRLLHMTLNRILDKKRLSTALKACSVAGKVRRIGARSRYAVPFLANSDHVRWLFETHELRHTL